MNILLFGPPGSGKGTQSSLLVERQSMKHISTGDLFRANIKNKTPLGTEAKSYLDKGNLVPDSVTINMVDDALNKLEGRSFILDGFPRNTAQAEALKGLLAKKGLKLEKALFLEVARERLVDRLSGRRTCRDCGAAYHIVAKPTKLSSVCDNCGSKDIYQRDDDRAEAIATRLRVYDDSTSPLKVYYEKSGLLEVIDGEGEVEQIFQRIVKATNE